MKEDSNGIIVTLMNDAQITPRQITLLNETTSPAAIKMGLPIRNSLIENKAPGASAPGVAQKSIPASSVTREMNPVIMCSQMAKNVGVTTYEDYAGWKNQIGAQIHELEPTSKGN